MKETEILKRLIIDYNRFVTQEINEMPPCTCEFASSHSRELYELIQAGVEQYKNKRNNENILFGQLGLGLFALQQGNFIPIALSDEHNSMVAEIIRYFNRFISAMRQTVDETRLLSEAAQNGDFTKLLCEGMWQGEIKNLIGQINRLSGEINRMLAGSYQSGLALAQSANALKVSTQSLSSATSEQAAALDQTVSSLEELTERVQSNAQHTVTMTRIANETETSAQNGMKAVGDTVNAVTSIRHATDGMKETLKLIDTIASQTNILSLNAAIEATRAGESGRGFAVVAVEVRKLAARSAEAAKTIRELSELVALKSDDAIKRSSLLRESLETLNGKIVENVQIIAHVAEASNEQMAGIIQINQALGELDKVTQENAQIAEDTDSVAQEVSALATQIVDEASSKRFFIGSEIAGMQQ